MSVLLDVDPWGKTERMSYDHATGNLTIETTQDIGAILANNAEMSAAGFDKRGDFWPYASVPLTVLVDWLSEFEAKTGQHVGSPFAPHADWERFVYGRLESNEFYKLRTSTVRGGR